MSNGIKILLALVVTGAIFAGTMFAMYSSAYNFGNSMEAAIEAEYEANKTELSAYSQKIRESVGVANIGADKVQELVGIAMNGRYGEAGMQAKVAMVMEAIPNLDQGSYISIVGAVNAGRDSFKTRQNMLTEKVRAYKTALGSFVQGWFLNMAGFPRSGFDFDKYKPIVSTYAKNAFETGEETGNVLDGLR